MHLGVVVPQLPLLHLRLRQLLDGLPEVGVLGTRDGVASGRAVRARRALPPGSTQLTGFLLHSMKPIWPLG